MEIKTTILAKKQSINLSIAGFILMFMFGALAMILHAKFRLPLHLPGRHGLEFMLLLLIGKNITQLRFSGLAASMGVSSMLFVPFLGFKDPFMAAVFVLPGIAMDVIFYFFPKLNSKMWMQALVAGISYSIIPISRFIISDITGIIYGSLISGLLYPILTHFTFGFIGGLGGTSLVKVIRKKK